MKNILLVIVCLLPILSYGQIIRNKPSGATTSDQVSAIVSDSISSLKSCAIFYSNNGSTDLGNDSTDAYVDRCGEVALYLNLTSSASSNLIANFNNPTDANLGKTVTITALDEDATWNVQVDGLFYQGESVISNYTLRNGETIIITATKTDAGNRWVFTKWGTGVEVFTGSVGDTATYTNADQGSILLIGTSPHDSIFIMGSTGVWSLSTAGFTLPQIREEISDSTYFYSTLSDFTAVAGTTDYPINKRIKIGDTGAEYLISDETPSVYIEGISKINTQGGKYAILTSTFIEAFGAKGDYEALDSLSINVGSDTVRVVGHSFSSSDIGKTIIVWGAGKGTDGKLGDELVAKIIEYISSASVRIDSTASVSVTHQNGGIGTDNTPIIQKVIDSIEIKQIEFTKEEKYFFRNNTTKYHCLRIEGKNNFTVIGNNAYLYFISSNPNSYLTGSQPQQKLFSVVNSDFFTIRAVNVFNIGQTQARVDTLFEGRYYSNLNGAPVTYNRRYNKTANNGAFVYNNSSNNTTIEDCSVFEVGSLYVTSNIAYQDINGCSIKSNKVFGYGSVAIYPGSNSIVSDNFIDNSTSPISSATEQDNDFGTSHGMYVTSSMVNVKIVNNTIRNARVAGIQFNTSTIQYGNTHLVQGNTFYRASKSLSLIGSNTLDIDVKDNHFYRCGGPVLTNSGILRIINNDFLGWQDSVLNSGGNSLTFSGAWKNVEIIGNTFDSLTAASTSAGVFIFSPSSVDNKMIIKGNLFKQGANYAIYANSVANISTNGLIIENNNFETKVLIGANVEAGVSGTTSKIRMQTNVFNTKTPTALIFYQPIDIVNNVFYINSEADWLIVNYSKTGTDNFRIVKNTFISKVAYPNAINLSTSSIRNCILTDNMFIGNIYFKGVGGSATNLDTMFLASYNNIRDSLFTRLGISGQLIHKNAGEANPDSLRVISTSGVVTNIGWKQVADTTEYHSGLVSIVSSGTTDASGDITVGGPQLGTDQYAVSVQVTGTTLRHTTVHSKTSSDFKVRFFDSSGTVLGAGVSVSCDIIIKKVFEK